MAASSCFADEWTGQLRPGLKADFAVVDKRRPMEDLPKTEVCQTWVDGERVYDYENQRR